MRNPRSFQSPSETRYWNNIDNSPGSENSSFIPIPQWATFLIEHATKGTSVICSPVCVTVWMTWVFNTALCYTALFVTQFYLSHTHTHTHTHTEYGWPGCPTLPCATLLCLWHNFIYHTHTHTHMHTYMQCMNMDVQIHTHVHAQHMHNCRLTLIQ